MHYIQNKPISATLLMRVNNEKATINQSDHSFTETDFSQSNS